jgi:ASC-1-like (ASCH) protein
MIHTFLTSNPKDIPVLDHLISGKKTVEGRPYSKKYHNVKRGNTIILKHKNKKHNSIVKSVKRYKTLEDYLKGEGLKKTLPGVTNFDDAIKIYNRWSSPTRRSQLESKFGFGMLAIRV